MAPQTGVGASQLSAEQAVKLNGNEALLQGKVQALHLFMPTFLPFCFIRRPLQWNVNCRTWGAPVSAVSRNL